MNGTTYRILIDGQPQEKQDIGRVREELARLFRTTTAAMDKFLAGRPVLVRKGLSGEEAERYRQAIKKTGARCIIEKEPIPPATTEPIQALPRCPKCSHQAQYPADPLLTGAGGQGECPRCGIIVSKFLERKSQEAAFGLENPIPSATSTEPAANEKTTTVIGPPTTAPPLPVADLKRRANAGIYTYLRMTILYLAIRIPMEWLVFATVNWNIHFSDKKEIRPLINSLITFENWLWRLLVLGVVIYALILVPSRHGWTWGQKRYGLRIVDHQANPADGLSTLLRRFLAYLVAHWTLGLALLIPFFRKAPHPKSLADMISGTKTLYDADAATASRLEIRTLALCLVLAIIFAFSHVRMIQWTETAIHSKLYPEGRTAAEKKAYQEQQMVLQQAQERWAANIVISRCNQGDQGACEQLETLEEMCRDGDKRACGSLGR